MPPRRISARSESRSSVCCATLASRRTRWPTARSRSVGASVPHECVELGVCVCADDTTGATAGLEQGGPARGGRAACPTRGEPKLQPARTTRLSCRTHTRLCLLCTRDKKRHGSGARCDFRRIMRCNRAATRRQSCRSQPPPAWVSTGCCARSPVPRGSTAAAFGPFGALQRRVRTESENCARVRKKILGIPYLRPQIMEGSSRFGHGDNAGFFSPRMRANSRETIQRSTSPFVFSHLSPIDLTSPMKVVDGAFFWASSKALLKFHSGRPLSRAPPPTRVCPPPTCRCPRSAQGLQNAH